MSTFSYNSTGIDPNARDFRLIPDGWWPFRIMGTKSRESSKGNPMVEVKCKCIHPLQSDAGLVWHYVVFLPRGMKGDKMNVQFRKCIGVPWEGDVIVDPEEWIGKTFIGKVSSEEYNGRRSNKIKEVSPTNAVSPGAEDGPF